VTGDKRQAVPFRFARDAVGILVYELRVAVMLWLKYRQLGSKDAAVRRKAMQELCASPTVRALEALCTALGDDDVDVRRLAVTALAKLEDERRLDPLLAALRDRDPEVLQTTIGALKRFNDERVPAALAPLIFHPDTGVRGRAAQVLDQLGWKPANREEEIWFAVARNQLAHAATHGIAALPALEGVLNGGPYNLRVAAVEAIASINDKRVTRPLLAALKSPDPAVCGAAVDALGSIGDPQCVAPIIGVLRHADAHARVVAAEWLGRMNATAAIEPLRALLRDPAWDVRRAAAEALGRLKDATSVEALTQNLDDQDADVREATALALGSMNDRRAIGPLVKSLKDSTSGVRRIAAAALARIDEDWSASTEAHAAVEELKSALHDKDPDVRHLVGRLLSSLGHSEPGLAATTPTEEKLSASSPEKRRKLAVSLFVATLCDVDRDLRQAAAEALGRLGDERVQSALVRALGDDDAGVRSAAETALKLLGGERAKA
jgi:HEAT repeat protein